MLKRSSTVMLLILAVVLIGVAMLYVAYGFVLAAPNKDSPVFLFWLEVAKSASYLLAVGVGAAIAAGLLKLLFDRVQARRQIDAAKDQFRKDLIKGFIDARYEATGKRDKFLSAPADQLQAQYRKMMEDEFIVIKEKLSRVWHDVETGKQSLTHGEKIKDNVIAMKGFFDDLLAEHRTIKDSGVPSTMQGFKELPCFGDFLMAGSSFRAFLESYREALRLLRLDLLGDD